MNSELGISTLAPLKVATSVERTLIRLTMPSLSLTTTQSPSLIGRSISTIRPQTKLLMTVCKPKPIPTDSAPATTVRPVRSRPATEAA